jgi:hypothetical protein
LFGGIFGVHDLFLKGEGRTLLFSIPVDTYFLRKSPGETLRPMKKTTNNPARPRPLIFIYLLCQFACRARGASKSLAEEPDTQNWRNSTILQLILADII